ncbi:MAG: response regulator [Candidatus Omnitrophica bacterium]|nr:response regulator [Candidatus Omnitrophota bacterium]
MEKRRVMIIDDEEDFLKVIKLNLEGTGKFEVDTLSSAKDIIPRMHSFRPEVILLDLLMPGIGGIEACEMLNSDPIGQGLPIIILSALDKETDKVNAYKRGVVDYLTKPIGKDLLISKIEKALDSK